MKWWWSFTQFISRSISDSVSFSSQIVYWFIPSASGPAANLYRPSGVYKIFCQPTTLHISFIYFRLNFLIKSKALSLFLNFQILQLLLIYKFQMPVRRIPQKRPSLIPSHRQQIGNACHLAYVTVCHHFIDLKISIVQ